MAASIPSAAPLAAQAHGLLAGLAARAVVWAHLGGPGRWAVAVCAVVVAWLVGKLGAEILAALLRWALVAAALLFAYQMLRV